MLPIKIEKLSHDGRGIAHQNGKTIFIQNALPEEEVLFNFTHKYNKYDEGIAQEIFNPSPYRINPICPYYHCCGGCSLQHLDSNQQIKHKQQVLLEQLEHFAKTNPEEIAIPLTGPTSKYRYKARLGIRYVTKKNKLFIGFREKSGHLITDMDQCPLLHPCVGEKIHLLRSFIMELSCFNFIPQIEVAAGEDKIALIIRHLQPFSEKDLLKIKCFAQREKFDIFLQPGKLDTIYKIYPQDNQNRLSYQLPNHHITFQFHPTDFTQINPFINQKMVDQAIAWLQIHTEDDILDLFCGLGNFTLPLAQHGHQIIGIEGDKRMVERAQENASLNQLTNTTFYAVNLNESIQNCSWANQKFSAILIDPPRSGAENIINTLSNTRAKRILYVSCNPATLARDAYILVHTHGFTLKKVGVIDMFPHTSHVESMALFVKK